MARPPPYRFKKIMQISKLDIFNLALTALGQDTIASTNEDNATAKRLRLLYDVVLEQEIRSHDWKFCSRDIRLALSPEKITGWEYAYNRPEGAVFVKNVFNDFHRRNSARKADFAEMANGNLTAKIICCNLENAYAHVSYLITNPAFYDALFVDVLKYALAKEIAFALTGDSRNVQLMNSLYAAALNKAEAADLLEENITPVYGTDFIEARG